MIAELVQSQKAQLNTKDTDHLERCLLCLCIGKALMPKKIVGVGGGCCLESLLVGTEAKAWHFSATQNILSFRIPEKVDLVYIKSPNCYHDCILAVECLKKDGCIVVDGGDVDRFCTEFHLPHENLSGLSVICNDDLWREDVRCLYMNHDRNKKDYIRSISNAGDVMVDVGANHGEYSTVFSKLVGPTGRVIAFEPVKESVEYLRSVLPSNVTVEEIALSDREGETGLHVFQDLDMTGYTSLKLPTQPCYISKQIDPLNSYVFKTDDRATRLTTLDKYVADHGIDRIDFIKVDIEGGELDFLKGSVNVLTNMRPKIMCELSDARTCDFGYKAIDIVNYLTGFGYRWFTCNEDSSLSRAKFGQQIILDCIAIPKELL